MAFANLRVHFRTRSIPFALKAGPEFTPEEEDEILAAGEEAKNPDNLIGPFSNAEDLIASMNYYSSGNQ